MSLDDLALLSPADVIHAWRWKQKHEEIQTRNTWEQTRLLAAYIISPYSKKKITSLSKFMPFEWDDNKPENITPERRAQMMETIAKLDEMHRKKIEQNGA